MDWFVLMQVLIWPVVLLFLALLLYATGNVRSALQAAASRPDRYHVSWTRPNQGNRQEIESLQRTITHHRSKINLLLDRFVHLHELDAKRQQVMEDYVLPILNEDVKEDLRCTVHVPDALFAGAQYQLLDYYPHGGGGGRAKSFRFGIIGKAWRTGEHQIEGQVPYDPDYLVTFWGMTRREADVTGRGRHSFACIVLRDDNDHALGLFYLDSRVPDAFGYDADRHRLPKAVLQGAQETGLVATLCEIHKEMQQRGPAIRVLTSRWR